MVVASGCAQLALLLLAPFGGSHGLAGAALVGWVVEQRADIMNEQGVKELGNFLLVGKLQGPFVWNPAMSRC